MSAPDTDVEKQAKRHAGPIVGIAAGLTFAAILLVVYLFYISSPADDTPDITPTGEAVQTEGNATITPDDAATDQNPASEPAETTIGN